MFSSNTSQVSSDANWIEECFQTHLYTGNSSTQTITNGIDLSGKGGLVWRQGRSAATGGMLIDTARGIGSYLLSYSTDAAQTGSNWIDSFNSNGFTMNSSSFNGGATYASWTFRKQPKFFDVVTYTGTGSTRTVSHNLGSVPGCMIIKDTTNAGSAWAIYHTSLGNTQYLQFSTDAAGTSSGYWNNTSPTSTEFTVRSNGNVNQSGATYVAYLFAHDAGGFGLTGTDNVISCGSFTTDGSGNSTVNLGYEPQWLLVKANASGNDWYMYDNMRGLSYSNYVYLSPNLSAAEGNIAADYLVPTATGFNTKSFASSTTYIYIAIRRGPMKVPTSGTSVFTPVARSGTGSTAQVTASFAPDASIIKERNTAGTDWGWYDKLRGNTKVLRSALTNAEITNSTTQEVTAFTNTGFSLGSTDNYISTNTSGYSYINYALRRAPSFFDEVCYTGTGSARTLSHNLGVAPEMMIIKSRSGSGVNYAWPVYAAPRGATQGAYLNSIDEFVVGYGTPFWNDTAPTASVFTLGTTQQLNGSGSTYVAYLFATCAGVSKVGSYTGTGTTLQVNCGFTAGSRFVLIKRTDSTGGWYVWDSARGIVSGNDPYLLLNSTAAEVTSTDYIDTYSAGFEISSTAPAAINASGGTFIFLAIA